MDNPIFNYPEFGGIKMKHGLSQQVRLIQLNPMAITQMESLLNHQGAIKNIK